MLDFTSALYLGLRHPSGSLGDWESLTLGRPSALREPPDAEAVAADLARLQGCEAGALATVDAAPVLGSVRECSGRPTP